MIFNVLNDKKKYLPLTGGTVDGNITQYKNSQSYITHALRNSARHIYSQIDPDGKYNLYDATNSKSIIHSTANGTNTFNGTANGNLPSEGGTLIGSLSLRTDDSATRTRTVSFRNADDTSFGGIGAYSKNGVIEHLYIGVGSEYYRTKNSLSFTADSFKWKDKDVVVVGKTANNNERRILTLNNSNSSASGATLAFSTNDTVNGELGVSSEGEAMFITSGGSTKKLLHTGNSAKVHIGTTAPSDTSALWIDTSA